MTSTILFTGMRLAANGRALQLLAKQRDVADHGELFTVAQRNFADYVLGDIQTLSDGDDLSEVNQHPFFANHLRARMGECVCTLSHWPQTSQNIVISRAIVMFPPHTSNKPFNQDLASFLVLKNAKPLSMAHHPANFGGCRIREVSLYQGSVP
jgi:hypothetical protein